MQTDPAATTVADICVASMRECGALGVGQTALADDLADAQARLQWMLQQWERKRWLVYSLVTFVHTSTGALSYTVGPGGDIDTGVGSVRPARLESAFLRQLVSSQPIDYPLEILQAREDYNRVTLKQLTSFTGACYYQPDWPLGTLFPVPIPQANLYALGLSFMTQLPSSFARSNVAFNLPYESYAAMLYNLALRLRPKYGLGTWPGDPLPGLAADSLNVLRGANTQIGRLVMPGMLLRPGIYNIFSDRSY